MDIFAEIKENLQRIEAEKPADPPAEKPIQKVAHKLKKLGKSARKPKQAKLYTNCSKHPDCRRVKRTGAQVHAIRCPWCDNTVLLGRQGAWCRSCYCLYREDAKQTEWHFGKRIQKSIAEQTMINIEKGGGLLYGHNPEKA